MHTALLLLEDHPWVVLLAAWGAVAILIIYFFRDKSRAMRRQAEHACTRCARPLSPGRGGLMCERCERRTHLRGWAGYYLFLGMSLLFVAGALALLTSSAGRKDAAMLASTVGWAAAAYYVARRIRPTT